MKSDFEWTVVEAGKFWPSDDGIPSGEEWEVYISVPSANHPIYLRKDEKTMTLVDEHSGVFQSFPSRIHLSIYSDDSTSYSASLSPQGFKLTKEEKIYCDIAMIVRARRIR